MIRLSWWSLLGHGMLWVSPHRHIVQFRVGLLQKELLWEIVRLNPILFIGITSSKYILFSKDYKELLPQIKKVLCNGLLGSEIVIYVDNNRINAASEELAWQVSSSLAKDFCWLGL